ncbi:hypothetical protein [Fluviicola taffensis]|uniref:Uncharacterized protein n=1 Tax=Fluviicola taffensis (strain DSM 16823 / NCIMB 13979 / RW262) TaxID=755732 RepID=F2IG49_FLUTR|nr:hypothetical protein [Fluviicola taffensis]AEA44684.1 hypothetical protein Fluta_2703 [Fluviicola taffensis DSM 16823]
MLRIFFLLCFVFTQITDCFSQAEPDSVGRNRFVEIGRFIKNRKQEFGFHEQIIPAKNGEEEVKVSKTVGIGKTDVVNFVINLNRIPSIDSIQFSAHSNPLEVIRISDSKCLIQLKASNKDYQVQARYRNQLIGVLDVSVLPVLEQEIRIVPLVPIVINSDSLEEVLNNQFRGANVHFNITVEKLFKIDEFDKTKLFENPSASRLKYTDQMRNIRDTYLIENKPSNSLLFFVVPGFVNQQMKGFMVKNKALGFLADNQNANLLAEALTKEYLEGFVNIPFAKEKRINDWKLILSQQDWIRVNNNPGVYSLVDDYEDVVTNNGLIAYYLFEQTEDGTILIKNANFLASVIRPMKKNTYSYHLQIDNFLFKTIFRIKSRPFNSLHLLSVIISFVGLIYGFRKLRAFLKSKLKKPRLVSFLSRFIQWSGIIVISYVLIKVVDLGYSWFEVNDGIIKSYNGLKEKEVIDLLFSNNHPSKLEEKQIGSELIIKRKDNYFLYERKKVLYFKMNIGKDNLPMKLRLISSSDSLKTNLLPEPIVAKSHYMVVKIYSPKGKWLRDQVYNHLGVDLTQKLELEDPPKRILIFVNGYRPTSLGSSFEENFKDIRSNGLEFPNSLNRLFTEDRYSYWHPWKQIDDAFKMRINPTEYYYADGHHSVATSNHRSLINFSTNSSIYPKRCADNKNHICYTTSTVGSRFFGSKQAKTLKLLATKSNKKGFKIRENGGRIAGRNLVQMLNELPNTSKNDTLYIVAHSMGFAYAQGLINEVRGKINFGSYYILAPENASAGTVNLKEWNQVWQYGSNLYKSNQDAPCLQDGVAPQSSVKGLNEERRIYIPKKLFKNKGYFDSHFIGLYTWVLMIPTEKKGHIRQR